MSLNVNVDDVIYAAANVIKNHGGDDCSESFRAGVIAVATELCFDECPEIGGQVMGYAVCGVFT